MKVRSTRLRGATKVLTAIGAISLVAAVLVGAGVVPPSGATAAPLSDGVVAVETLEATEIPEKAEAVREAEIPVASAALQPDSRVPTPIAKPKPKPRPKPAASAASPSGWRSAKVSWYGPGFYGNTMAGGGKLTPDSMVVAHRSMAFGTRIEFSYKGRTCIAVVRDRGPYIAGRMFDLGPGTAKALGFSGVGTVQYRILGR